MLRPAVAATNCAKAGKTTGSDMGDRAPVDARKPERAQSARAGGGRQRRPENSVITGPGTGLSRRGPDARSARPGALRNIRKRACCASERGNPWPGLAGIPDKTPLFLRMSKAPVDTMMTGALWNTAPRACSLQNWVASDGYLTSCRTRRRRQQVFCIDLRG